VISGGVPPVRLRRAITPDGMTGSSSSIAGMSDMVESLAMQRQPPQAAGTTNLLWEWQ
jgi:hypothetical protein